MAALAVSTVPSAAVVSTEAALVEAVFTPLDLVAVASAARRSAAVDSGPDTATDSEPA
jgi:hypothetical protein